MVWLKQLDLARFGNEFKTIFENRRSLVRLHHDQCDQMA